MLRFQRNRDNSPAKSAEFPFVHPQSLEEVAGILRFKGTTFIYKHSTRCSVSLFAMKRLLTVDPVENEQWVYIDVVAQRSLSLALAEELNVPPDELGVDHFRPLLLRLLGLLLFGFLFLLLGLLLTGIFFFLTCLFFFL